MSAAKRKKSEPAPEALPGAGTPEGESLRDAAAAFEAGDYARVRRLSGSLASAGDPKVRDAAAELLRRVAVDPVQIGFLVLCLLALGAIAWVYVLR